MFLWDFAREFDEMYTRKWRHSGRSLMCVNPYNTKGIWHGRLKFVDRLLFNFVTFCCCNSIFTFPYALYCCGRAGRQMDGWTDGWLGVGGWMNVRTDGWKDGFGCMDG
jgi:hypothetical protein